MHPFFTLALLFSLPTPPAPPPPIDPTWVYVTPIHWQRIGGAPHSNPTRTSSTTTVVLYPEGQYLEITAFLYRHGSDPVMIPGNDGLLIRTGTWSRTDDRVIRITSREVLSDKIIKAVHCTNSPTGPICPPPNDTEPGPPQTDTCALEGTSKTHLAQAILCKRISFAPLTLPLNLTSLNNRAQEGFAVPSR